MAVIDVGSNSVRLVTYEALGRSPAPLFNERVLCGLGRSLERTGRLDEEGKERVLEALARFAALIEVGHTELIDAVATAAIRDAEDGEEFLARVADRCGLELRVLSGPEEARLSALGVVSGTPDAHGLMGDLGGGSLELVAFERGTPGLHATLPLGPLRLKGMNGLERARAVIGAALAETPWLAGLKGRDFYAVGGGWRALARIHIAQTNYPIRVVHQYRLRCDVVRDLANLISGLGANSLAMIPGVPRRRLDVLPFTALAMVQVLTAVEPKSVVFSAYGLREGLLFDRLSASVQALDPLLEGCARMAESTGRGVHHAAKLHEWTGAVFADEEPGTARLRHAACLLNNITWRSHPDYRAIHALQTVLSAPLGGIDHADRAFLALVLYARYGGDEDDGAIDRVRAQITEEKFKCAWAVGLALRLAHALIPVSAEPLKTTALADDGEALTLTLRGEGAKLMGGVVRKRFRDLAAALDVPSRIEVEP